MSGFEYSHLVHADSIGKDIFSLIEQLFPICRSITGDGVRATLKHICEHIPLDVHEVPTGTQIYDWTVPREWNIKDAYIKNQKGEKIVDFHNSNLHVVGYSIPVQKKISLDELKEHVFSIPEKPEWIPYRTSYYNESWGFCISHRQLMSMEDGIYDVLIDSSLEDGTLTYGEYVLPGEIEDEILLSAHICHPSLANDNLSGIALLTHLAKHLQGMKHKYTYRFIFAPGTIGSLTWLARNEQHALSRVKHGLVVSCVGDDGGPTYKRSRRGSAEIDLAIEHVLKHACEQSIIEDFSPYGYDERQYCSPGFNLPVGLFERSKYGEFPQYHTSADNLEFISAEHLSESYKIISRLIDVLENNDTYVNTNPKGEPQLGKRGLYNAIGGDTQAAQKIMAMLWILNLSDGECSLLDISRRADTPFDLIFSAAQLLQENGLLKKADNKNSS
jgi:aminopeptidase-like protein